MPERAVVLLDARGREIVRTPARSDLARAGVGSGASIFGGQFMPFLLREPDELREQMRRHETFRIMGETDAYVAEVLRANTLPLVAQAKWRMAPAIEPKKGATPNAEERRAQDVANLLAANLLGQECEEYGAEFRQMTPWTQFLREVLKFLSHGFSIFHRQPKAVAGKLVYRRLLWLEPMTILRWDIDGNDELRGVYRNYVKPDGTAVSNEYLPVEELALFGWDVVGTRLEGLPLIRPMFGAWKREEFISRCKMIAVQQAGVGIPIATWDPNSGGEMNPDEFADRVEQALQSMLGAGLGTSYLAVPNPTFEAFFMKQDPETLKAFDEMAQPERLAKAHAGGTKSQMIGELSGGARATAGVQRALEYVMAQAIAEIIAEQMEMGVANVRGLIPELTDWNFAGIKRYSKLVADDVDPDERTRNLPLVTDGMKAGLVKYRPALEQMYLDRAGFKLPDDEFDTKLHPELIASPVAVGPDGKPLPPSPGPNGMRPKNGTRAEPAAPGDGTKIQAEDVRTARQMELRLSIERLLKMPSTSNDDSRSRGYGRTPTPFESKVCMLGMVSESLKKGGEQIASALRRASATMIEDILQRIAAGKLSREDPTRLRQSRPKGYAVLVESVRERFLDVARAGRQHAREELARQVEIASGIKSGLVSRSSVGLGLTAFSLENGDGFDETPPGYPNMLPAGAAIPISARVAAEIEALIQESGGAWQVITTLTTELAGEARVASVIAIDEIWARLVDEAIREYSAAIRSGLSEEAALRHVESALHGLSPSKQDLAGREVAAVAYNQGRDMAAKEAAVAGAVQWVVRSEVLDRATCEFCLGIDGTYFKVGTTDYEVHIPPAKCAGGDRCRGFMVLVSDELARVLTEQEKAA